MPGRSCRRFGLERSKIKLLLVDRDFVIGRIGNPGNIGTCLLLPPPIFGPSRISNRDHADSSCMWGANGPKMVKSTGPGILHGM